MPTKVQSVKLLIKMVSEALDMASKILVYQSIKVPSIEFISCVLQYA